MTPYARPTTYSQIGAPTRTDRGGEYAVFAKVTAALRAVDPSDQEQYPALVKATYDHMRLWDALEDDLRLEENALPVPLKAQLIGLSAFVRRQTLLIAAGKGSLDALIDINTAIMKGLRGEVETAA
jgi:flagellar biosynthesis activator protein FlaF